MKIVLVILAFLFSAVVAALVSISIDGHLTTLETMITGGITFALLNRFIDAVKQTLYPEKTNDSTR